jgi:hypothetical protein
MKTIDKCKYYENNIFNVNFYNIIYDLRKYIFYYRNNNHCSNITCYTCYEKINYTEIHCAFDKTFCTKKCRNIYIRKYNN